MKAEKGPIVTKLTPEVVKTNVLGGTGVKIVREKDEEQDIIYGFPQGGSHKSIAEDANIPVEKVAYAGSLNSARKVGSDAVLMTHGGSSMNEYQYSEDEEEITAAMVQVILGNIEGDLSVITNEDRL